MCWAIDKVTRAIVHVSSLDRSRTGLRCGCLCPACEGDLQAVNAGRTGDHFLKAGSRGQFFRHQGGQQKNRCLLLAARIAALQLLYESAEVDVPGPRRSSTITGASGALYGGDAVGTRYRARIRARHWVDAELAHLTMDDGRVVLLTLESRFGVDVHGHYDGVIVVKVDDPDVASWSAEAILARAVLDGGLVCWGRHWDDAALDLRARQAAEQEARQAVDFVGDGVSVQTLTLAQRSESALHLAIKDILLKASSIRVADHEGSQQAQLADGREIRESYRLGYESLGLRRMRLEEAVGSFVPDVIGEALHVTGNFSLLIEVVVTHPVHPEKLEKIRAARMACLVVDIRLFRRRGRITLDALRREVLENADSNRWLWHPAIERQEAQANAKLRAAQRSATLELERRVEFTKELEAIAADDLPARLLDAVLLNAHPEATAFGPHSDLGQIVAVMAAKGWNGVNDEALTAPHGILHAVFLIQQQVRTRSRSIVHDVRTFADAPRLRIHTGLLLMAVKAYAPKLSASEQDALDQLRHRVKTSVDAGEFEYARPTHHDRLLGALFPKMRSLLSNRYATVPFVRERREQLRKEELAQREQIQRDQVRRAAEEERVRVAADVELAIQRMASVWNPPLGMSRDLEQAMGRKDVMLEIRRLERSGIDAVGILASAFDARNANESLSSWVRKREPQCVEQIRAWIGLLRAAWLV